MLKPNMTKMNDKAELEIAMAAFKAAGGTVKVAPDGCSMHLKRDKYLAKDRFKGVGKRLGAE